MTSRADIAAGKGSGATRTHTIAIEAIEPAIVPRESFTVTKVVCNTLLWTLVLSALAISIWATVRVIQM